MTNSSTLQATLTNAHDEGAQVETFARLNDEILAALAATTRDFTVWFVGDTIEEARERMPFDACESASEYADDEGGNVYSATVTLHFDTMEVEAS